MLSLLLWQWLAVVLVTAAVSGGLVGVLMRQQSRTRQRELEQQQEFTAQQLSQQQQQAEHLRAELLERVREQEARAQQWQTEYSSLKADYSAMRAGLSAKLESAAEKQQVLERSEERLKQECERLAQQIFEQKSERLQANSKQTLESTLAPFKQQLDAFKQQVTQQYTEELKQRSELSAQVSSLRELNQQMAAEAKTQGAWGEVVLERILNQSGLREGQEYHTQSQHKDADGRSFKPDVIVHLPNNKDVIIDSKVSLLAYERYFNSDDDATREQALNEHVNSLRQHIRGLGKKNYQQLDGVRTLDYVLMFIPIEPAFLLAVDRDPELIRLALDNNIMLVSPTNLLVALRTVNNIWQYEYQNQNAQTIAEEAGKLYDKFVGFVDDIQRIGQSLDTVRKHYDGALNKLSTGRGNLVRRVERFRELGVQSTKQIDRKLLGNDDVDSDASDS